MMKETKFSKLKDSGEGSKRRQKSFQNLSFFAPNRV